MSDIDDVLEDLKQRRDEARVRLHLASREMRDEWEELEDKMEHFTAKAHLRKTGKDVGKSLGQLGHELKLGYERLRDALKD
ncbi:MAG: hypothetical protein U5K76_09400 [Woeseiaceae bacterium]|nr:hypothetical protein [Woeseiaceae bacterium]